MAGVVVDTHAIVWFLSRDSRLSPRARDVLRSTMATGEIIHVPSICLVELTYFVEKGRLPVHARDELIQAIDDPTVPCSLAPLDRLVADALGRVKRSEVADLPDRIVAATSVALEAPLISRDGKIHASQVQTIW
jgi:PIN domain nuclease of toxin-antitoxin system